MGPPTCDGGGGHVPPVPPWLRHCLTLNEMTAAYEAFIITVLEFSVSNLSTRCLAARVKRVFHFIDFDISDHSHLYDE